MSGMTDVWEAFWPIIEAQHAVFARWQAAAHGITKHHIAKLVQLGVLEILTRRVLRVRGCRPTPEQDLMAAVLEGGPGTMAWVPAAAWLWGIPGFTPGSSDVARMRSSSTRTTGADHWPRLLPEHHVTVVRGIPVPTLARTIFGLAAMPRHAHRIGQIIDSIDGKSPSLLVAMHEMLPELAKQGRNGIVVTREALESRPPDRIRLTGLERKFEDVLTRAHLYIPRRQIDLGGHQWIGRVDYYDDPIKVIYEVDSKAHHTSLTDRLNDERRDREALAAGFNEVVRIPEEHVWYEPWKVASVVRRTRQRWNREAA
jgi:very-short-patch-repair endonuclease